jgi:hypothetical protein
MPSRDEHLSKARNNKGFADAIKPSSPTSIEWAWTAIFYSALHYVEAFHAIHEYHCRDHHGLRDAIERNPRLSVIADEYVELLDYSWNARYNTRWRVTEWQN